MPSRPIVRRMILAALPCLALAAAAPAAQAGDPLSASFRKLARQEVSGVKATAKLAVKTVKADLKGFAADYSAGETPIAEAVSQAVVSVTGQRDALLDGAGTALFSLAAGGVGLLDGFAGDLPPADFRAGGGGAWDDAVTGIDAALDKADAQLSATCFQFIESLRSGAAKQGLELDVRLAVPPHSAGFRAVESPGVPDSLAGDAAVVELPQVLIAVRTLETSQSARLHLGVRFDGGGVDVTAATTEAESAELGTVSPGPEGTGTETFDISSLEDQGNFLRVDVAAGADLGVPAFLSAPRLGEDDPDLVPFAADLKQALKDAKQDFGAQGSAAVKALRAALGSHLKAVKGGQATVELALRTGFGNLADAREDLGIDIRAALGTAIEDAGAALAGAGFTNADITPDFAPDAPGVYGDAAASTAALLERLQAQAGGAFTGFVAKLLKLAAKQGEAVGAAVVAGNTGPLQWPFLSDAPSNPPELQTAVLLTDALTLITVPVLAQEYDVNLIIQTDPQAQPGVESTAIELPEGGTVVIGGLTAGEGGTAKKTGVPLLGDLPVLGWLFRAGKDEAHQEWLLILIKPTLVDDG
jgi:hypothetical protein